MKLLVTLILKKEIEIIPNFVDFNCHNLSENLFLKSKKKEKKILTHISNFRPVKRVLDVIEIFRKVNKEIDSSLYMVGDGPDLNKCKDLVSKYKLNEKVKFLEKVKK